MLSGFELYPRWVPLNNGIKTGGHCENEYDLPFISRCKTVVN